METTHCVDQHFWVRGKNTRQELCPVLFCALALREGVMQRMLWFPLFKVHNCVKSQYNKFDGVFSCPRWVFVS